MFHAEAAADPSVPLGVSVTIMVIGTILGGGGIAAVLKAWYDRKQGVESNEIVEDDAIVARWKELSQAQIEMLLNPLKTRLTDLEATVEKLEQEVNRSRKKYWLAIPYIRALRDLLHLHAPTVAHPPLPTDIADDI